VLLKQKRIIITFILSVFLLGPLQAQYNADRYFAYLENAFNKHDKSLRKLLMDELQLYLTLFPGDANAGRVQYMLGKVFLANGDEAEALACFLKLIVMYPASGVIDANKDDARSLIANESDFRDHQKWLNEILDKNFKGLTAQKAFLEYLTVLIKLELRDLTVWNLAACREFILRFPKDTNHDKVLLWMADTYAINKDPDEANSIIDKFKQVFPNSPQMAKAMFIQGQLNYHHLDQPQKAIDILSDFVTNNPSHEKAAEAYFTMGEIKEKEQKDKPGAIADYQIVTANYPDDKNAVESLWRIAEIYYDEKNNTESLASYDQIVTKYPGHPKGIEALKEMVSIFKRKLENYTKAAETLARIADHYPDHEDAAENILDAGILIENELEDYNTAISYYQKVIEKYPDSKMAKKAADRIQEAKEELNKPKD